MAPDSTPLLRTKLHAPAPRADRVHRQRLFELLDAGRRLSPFTVKKHLENIYGKLAVRNRTEAIGKAQVLGWLERAGA